MGEPASVDPALLAPLVDAVGITDTDRSGAPDLMRAMLKIQYAYLIEGRTVPQEITGYDRCILPKIRGNAYTFRDGGASAWKLRLACDRPAAVLIANCRMRLRSDNRDASPRCNIEPVLLAQAAMSVIGEP